MTTLPRQRALTLAELLIVLALVSIVSSIALPSISAALLRNRQEVLHAQWLRKMHFARARAILSGRPVIVCGSSDGASCDGEWSRGWLSLQEGSGEVLDHYTILHDADLKWRGFGEWIRFHPNGTTPASNGRMRLCGSDRSIVWQVVLNRQGRSRTELDHKKKRC